VRSAARAALAFAIGLAAGLLAILAQPGSPQWSLVVYQISSTAYGVNATGLFPVSALTGTGGVTVHPSTTVLATTGGVAVRGAVSARVEVYYGGSFNVTGASPLGTLVGSTVAPGRPFKANATFWSPYGVVDQVRLNFTGGACPASYLYNGSLYELSDPCNLFSPVNYSLSTRGGWVYFTLTLNASWGAGGAYDVWVYGADTARSYSASRTFAALFTVVNATTLHGYSFSKPSYLSGENGTLTLTIAYSGTDIGVEWEEVYVNGTKLVAGAGGVAVYNFTAPLASGSYVLEISLQHGGTYYLHFSVGQIILNLSIRTLSNATIRLPSYVEVYVYDNTTGGLLKTASSKESLSISLDKTGTYLIRVYYRGVKIAEEVVNQTQNEQHLTLQVVGEVTDSLGGLRGVLTNASPASYSYDNATRTLRVLLGGGGWGRLVYIANYTKPLLVLSNTTVSVQPFSGEIVVDVQLPANITILDPRMLRVTVANPYGVPFTPTIRFLNLGAWEDMANATAYEVPAQVSTKVVVSFSGVSVAREVSLLGDLNLTVELPYAVFTDYRGAARRLVANATLSFQSLSERYPYSSMRMLVSGSGGFAARLYIPALPTRLSVSSNTSVAWSLSGNWLTVTGTLHSTAEINVTDLYALRVRFYDGLGNLMPAWVYALVNSTEARGNPAVLYLSPGIYSVAVPLDLNGFRLRNWADGFVDSSRLVELSAGDVALSVYYRIPVSIEAGYKLLPSQLSWLALLGFQPFEQSGEASVYVEGFARDYYGLGVPGRRLVIDVTNIAAGRNATLAAVTDATGYFKTDAVVLQKNVLYRITVTFPGDDVYIASVYTFMLKVEEAPPIQAPAAAPWYLWLAVAAVAAVAIVAVAVYARRAAKHAVEDEFERRRRFVRRRRA